MRVYILVRNDLIGEVSINMPTNCGRQVRAYTSEKRAKAYAKRLGAVVVAFDLENGEEV